MVLGTCLVIITYSDLTYKHIANEVLIVMGDWNAKVGRE